MTFASTSDRVTRLMRLREGCGELWRLIEQLTESCPSCPALKIASDYLRCIEHEVKFVEQFPVDLFKERPIHRLSNYCNGAAKELTRVSGRSQAIEIQERAQSLSVAFLGLIPMLLEDYESIVKRPMRLHCA